MRWETAALSLASRQASRPVRLEASLEADKQIFFQPDQETYWTCPATCEGVVEHPNTSSHWVYPLIPASGFQTRYSHRWIILSTAPSAMQTHVGQKLKHAKRCGFWNQQENESKGIKHSCITWSSLSNAPLTHWEVWEHKLNVVKLWCNMLVLSSADICCLTISSAQIPAWTITVYIIIQPTPSFQHEHLLITCKTCLNEGTVYYDWTQNITVGTS